MFLTVLNIAMGKLRCGDEGRGKLPWSRSLINLTKLRDGWRLLEIGCQLLAPDDLQTLRRCEGELATLEDRLTVARKYPRSAAHWEADDENA